MIENDASGKAIGYEAGRRIHLVRNPNWDKSTDYKPAYLDEIDMPQGNDDTTVASRRVVEGEQHADRRLLAAAAGARARSSRARRTSSSSFPGGSARYVSMNTTVKPFDDINVRRAVVAGFNREAMRLVRGGELVGDIPTHMIPPGLPGFEEAGGFEGPGLDFMSKPEGDLALAASYFKKAGYASGKYEGDDELLMVGTSEGVAREGGRGREGELREDGLQDPPAAGTQDAMYTRFCNSPPANVAICPNVSWGKDFADAQTILDPTFNGKNIVQQGNSNWPELNVPEINKAMDEAELLTDPKERAEAWAKIDTMVTEQAPLVNWIWDKQALLRSADVNGAVSRFNSMWDLSWTSLK